MFKLSASQIKTFCGSKAKWAGQYILGIQDVYASQDALTLGHLAEHYIITKQDDYSILDKNKVIDGEKMIATYDIIKHNAQDIELPTDAVVQRKVEGELLGHHRVGYIDLCTSDCIYDIKTTQYLTKKDGAINMWSGMSTYDEYKLQLWIYSKLTGINNAKIVEVSKHEYKDKRVENQIIDYVFDDATHAEMEAKYKPVVDEMYDLYTKFKVNAG